MSPSSSTTPSDPHQQQQQQQRPQRIAVIGGGVAGLAAAWHLSQNTPHSVELFEAEDRLGGHAYTMPITDKSNGQNAVVDVDIGFMVFNHTNYPNLVQWFQVLGVAEEDSDMSLSVSLVKDDDGDAMEWNSDGLNGLLARRWNILHPHFYHFLSDMLRFHAHAPELLQLTKDDPRQHITTGQFLRQNGYSTAFQILYLLPMMAALWSASLPDVMNFPAAQLIVFLQNHQMLQVLGRPQWKTVARRSKQYTDQVAHVLRSNPSSSLHLGTPIYAVQRRDMDGTYQLTRLPEDFTDEDRENVPLKKQIVVGVSFDQIIFACHTDHAQALLARGCRNSNATDGGVSLNDPRLALLSNIEYQDNVVYVHSDASLMPQRRRAWASWNCIGSYQRLYESVVGGGGKSSPHGKKGEAMEGAESGFGRTLQGKNREGQHRDSNIANTAALEGKEGRMKAVFVTYWLNRLQNLTTNVDIFVSLNPHHRPAPNLTHHRILLAHPQFTATTIHARQQLLDTNQYQGQDGLWFCGAWAGYGFHEDGCRSGFEVATKLSQTALPWAPMMSTNPDKDAMLVLPPPDLSKSGVHSGGLFSWYQSIKKLISYHIPVAICKKFIFYFLNRAVCKGRLCLKLNDGSLMQFGDGSPCGCGDQEPVTLRIFDDWFFVKTAMEYDLGLARSYMSGYFTIEQLKDKSKYHPVMRPLTSREETTVALGDPIGLARLFLLFIGNRDRPLSKHIPRKAGQGHFYSNAMTNASGLIISKIGTFLNYFRYKMTMDNSERGGSLKNIHAHYDISNDLFTTFLDKETLMYSSAIYDAVAAPSPRAGLVFRGTLEQAQWRKLDTLLARAQVQRGQKVLDIGFGWGGLSIHAAKKYGCQVTGITLSVEQKTLAELRVKEEGLESLITFEVVDYRTFARRKENLGKFDRVLSCEMIEAVGHKHLGSFFWAVEQVLAHDGILVMEAITTPEQRYETYLRSTDLINTIIFPGSCCPSLHALVDAAYHQSTLTLEHVENIGLHYAETLAEWRRRFNANEATVRQLGFDDIFLRAWNYYLTYCQAGFFSQTENCLILVFARQGCRALAPLCETRSVTQANPLSAEAVEGWIGQAEQSQ